MLEVLISHHQYKNNLEGQKTTNIYSLQSLNSEYGFVKCVIQHMEMHEKSCFFGGCFGPIPLFRVGRAFESQTGYRTTLRGSPKGVRTSCDASSLATCEFPSCNLVVFPYHIDIGSGASQLSDLRAQ